MRLKAHMVKVNYKEIKDLDIKPKEFQNLSNNVILVVDNIEFLGERDYEDNTLLGEERKEGWIINTHYRGKGQFSKKQFYQIAFEIELEENENIEDFYLTVIGTNNKFEGDILRYNKQFNLFFDTCLFQFKGLKYEPIKTKGIANDSAGRFFVNIMSSKNKEHCYKSIPVMVLPSSVSYDDYITMIEDLISIREDIILNSSSKIGLGGKWDLRKDAIESCVNSIISPLNLINKNPSTTLKPYFAKQPFNSISKLTPRTLIERSLYPNKNKYTAKVYEESIDIYENRAIKNALKNLKKKIKFYKDKFEYEWVQEENHIQSLKNEFKKVTDKSILEKKEEIEIKKEKNNNLIERALRKGSKSNINDIDDKLLQDSNFMQLYFNVSKYSNLENNYITIKFNEEEENFTLIIESIWNDNLKAFSLDLKSEKFWYKTPNTKRDCYSFKGRKFKCTYTTDDINKIYFFLKELDKNNEKISIYAIANRKSLNLNDPFGGVTPNGKLYKIFTIDLVDIIEINKEKPIVYTKKEIEELIEKYNIIIEEEEAESLGFIDSIIQKEDKAREIKSILNGKEGWGNLENKIDTLLNLPMFKNVNEEMIPSILPTQIFINHSSYSLVFSNLTNLNKKVKFFNVFDTEEFLIKSTSNIYEMWCLYKIVDILINEQKWIMINKEEIIEVLDDFLSHNNRFRGIPLEIKFIHQLKNGDKEHLTLIYEGKIYYSHNEYKVPDYQFIFQQEDKYGNLDSEKRFYLDAKYRCYSRQQYGLFNADIKTVAIDKYIKHYEYKKEQPIASFIVHSDTENKYINFGGYFTESDKKFFDCDKVHAYGSFPLVPSEINNMRKFLKLITEYHLGFYQYCWNCGEVKDIDVLIKKTKGRNNKYHYFCNNCKEFWVKNHCYLNKDHNLIKHLDNYHYVDNLKHIPWYVICPECGSGKSKEEEDFNF